MEHRRRFPSIPNEVQIKFKSRKHFPRSAQTKSQGKSKLQNKKFPPQKVFYDGQIYDAFEQMKKFVRMAKKELIVIDPYFADSVLPLVAQKHGEYAIVEMCKCASMKTANAA